MVPPYFVPDIPPNGTVSPSAVWGDVVVANPRNLYRTFGDLGMLEEHFPQSQSWIDVGILRGEDGLWNRSSDQLGDHLDPKAPPDKPTDATTHRMLVADAYLVEMTGALAEMSKALGKSDESEKYRKQREELKARFQDEWISDGEMANRTQTAYSLALDFDLFPDVEQQNAGIETLRDIVQKNDHLVGTGFAGTPSLGFALRNNGATEDFYKMLLQTRVPSWLYQVVQNATTTGERWDSLLADGTINPGEMTSFNHYAFGSVADWMHQVIGGVAAAEPGWKRVSVAPVPGGGITRADSRFVSPYGEVRVKWWFEDNEQEEARHRNGFHMTVQIPPNSKADVKLPKWEETVELGSGYYEFHDPDYIYPRRILSIAYADAAEEIEGWELAFGSL